MKITDKFVPCFALSMMVVAAQPSPASAEPEMIPTKQNCVWVDQECTNAPFLTTHDCLEMGYSLDGRVCQDVLVHDLEECGRVGGIENRTYNSKGKRIRDLDANGYQKCQVVTILDPYCAELPEDPECQMNGASCERLSGIATADQCLATADHLVDYCSELDGIRTTGNDPLCIFPLGRSRKDLCEKAFEGEYAYQVLKPSPAVWTNQLICRIGPGLAQSAEECEPLRGTFVDGQCVVAIADLPPAPQCFYAPFDGGRGHLVYPHDKHACLELDQQSANSPRAPGYFKWATGRDRPGLRWNANTAFTLRPAPVAPIEE